MVLLHKTLTWELHLECGKLNYLHNDGQKQIYIST